MEEQSWCRWRICALTSALLLAVGFIAAGPLAQAQESAPPSIDVEELLAPYRDGLKDAMPAYSDEREAIVSYEVDATVLPNTDMRVDELITYNTGTDKVRHGLIRDIPTIDVLDNGMQRSYDISLIAVSRDGREVPYTVDDSGGALSLRIGDERVAILGRHEFRITYLVKNGLDVLQESDLIDGAPPEVSAGDVELYWDFVGDEWAFPVYEADVSIIGPAPALAAQCDADPGYGQGCAVDLNGGPRGATTMRASAMGWPWIEGYLSGVIAWAPDAFTQLPTPVISEPPQAAENTRAVRNLRISALLGLAALAIPIVIAITLRRRSRGVVLAASPVRFEPPSSLRPAELQAGMEGAVTASGIAATLLDLAARGHVTITEGERRLFQADGLELTRTGQGKDSLQGWEKQLLDTTFKGEGQATIGDFDPELGRAIKVISSQLGCRRAIVRLLQSGRIPPRSSVSNPGPRRDSRCSTGIRHPRRQRRGASDCSACGHRARQRRSDHRGSRRRAHHPAAADVDISDVHRRGRGIPTVHGFGFGGGATRLRPAFRIAGVRGVLDLSPVCDRPGS
jgi:hypothetical protein